MQAAELFWETEHDRKQYQKEDILVYLHATARYSQQDPLVSISHDREPP